MQGLNVVAAITVLGLALYFFVGKADESSKFIEALAKGYRTAVGTFTEAPIR